MNLGMTGLSAFLFDCLWQTTIILLLGMWAARWLRQAPAGAYHVLILSVGACLAAPVTSWGSRQLKLGLFPTPLPEAAVAAGAERAFSVPPDVGQRTSTPDSHAERRAISAPFPAAVGATGPQLVQAVAPVNANPRKVGWTTLLLAAWSLLSLLALSRLLRVLRAGSQVVERSRPMTDASIELGLARAAGALNVAEIPVLRLSDEIKSPMIWCWSRQPVILLPSDLAISNHSLHWEGLFCHELAHWKRKDHWASLLVELAVCAFPWQPLLWCVRSRLIQLREWICDDWVAYSGQGKAAFADTLLQLVPSEQPAATFPAAGRRKWLKERIARILSSAPPVPVLGRTWRFSALGLTASLIFAVSLMHEQPILGDAGEADSAQTKPAADPASSKPDSERLEGSGARMLRLPHVSFFKESALSPDGRWLAGGTWDFKVALIDTTTGSRRDLEQTSQAYGSVVWSKDGAEMAFIQYVMDDKRSYLRTCSPASDRLRTLMENPPHELFDWNSAKSLALGLRYKEPSVGDIVLIRLETQAESKLGAGGDEASARFSEDGDFILFVTEASGQSILHIRRTDATSESQYKGFAGRIRSPRWSPDRRHIVFLGEQDGIRDTLCDLWMLKVNGTEVLGEPVPIRANMDQIDLLNWTASGQLLYRSKFNLGGLFVLSVDPATGKTDSSPRRLFRSREWITKPCWSPDGQQLAVFSDGAVLLISAKTGRVAKEIKTPEIGYNSRGISWSPDGQRIALSVSLPTQGIYLVDTQDGKTERFLEAKDGFDVGWSPDGKMLVYGGVSIVDLQNRKPTQIARGGRPCFAPDGKSVAYMAPDGKKVMATTVDGKETRELFHLEEGSDSVINIFGWSPDGNFIVFTPGNHEVWAVEVPGGKPYKLADLPSQHRNAWAWFPRWSPDGKTIAFGVNDENSQFWVMESFVPAQQSL